MPKQKRPARETSDRVSRIAARMLRRWEAYSKVWDVPPRKRDYVGNFVISWGDLLALCGSALSQDETRGKRAKARRK